jgi:hypothetical protein
MPGEFGAVGLEQHRERDAERQRRMAAQKADDDLTLTKIIDARVAAAVEPLQARIVEFERACERLSSEREAHRDTLVALQEHVIEALDRLANFQERVTKLVDSRDALAQKQIDLLNRTVDYVVRNSGDLPLPNRTGIRRWSRDGATEN